MTDLLGLADEPFVSMTTYRRSGAPVSTPVWVARHGDTLVVTTPARSGKVKRLRRDPVCDLRACDRFGAVAEGAPTVRAHATILDDPADVAGPEDALEAEYGRQYRVLLRLERLVAALRRTSRDRVVLRLAAAPGS